MNLANSYNQENELDYQVEPERRSGKDKTVRDRKMQYSRSTRPAVHNGIHRRRNKRFSW
jgi:hypothetical protein